MPQSCVHAAFHWVQDIAQIQLFHPASLGVIAIYLSGIGHLLCSASHKAFHSLSQRMLCRVFFRFLFLRMKLIITASHIRHRHKPCVVFFFCTAHSKGTCRLQQSRIISFVCKIRHRLLRKLFRIRFIRKYRHRESRPIIIPNDPGQFLNLLFS